MKYAGDRRYLVYPRWLVKLAQANVHFKVTKSVVFTSEKKKKTKKQVLVIAWGIVSLKAVVWRKEKVMESLVSNKLNETIVWCCGKRDKSVVMKNASQHSFLENMSLQINIILFHVWVYLSGVYKYVQEEKISYTKGLFFVGKDLMRFAAWKTKQAWSN